jgi:hypothetical protein
VCRDEAPVFEITRVGRVNRHSVVPVNAVFACPPGIRSGDWVGHSLFSS